jgi:tetratricopeptide (TPR) repeat protein
MLARLVGIILGLILATSGYVVAGWGSLGNWATHLDLGPFEPNRPTVGVAAAIVGGVLIIAALLPRLKRKTRKAAPMAFGLELEEPLLAPEPQPTPTFVAAPPVAQPAPSARTGDHAGDAGRRARSGAAAASAAAAEAPDLRRTAGAPVSLSRTEAWADAARTLSAMKAIAHTTDELALLYRDLGDFARGQGQMDDAAEAYENSVSYAREVRQAQDTDETAELLAGSLSGVGDTAEAEGRLDAALSAFEEALALRRSRGGREAGDTGAQRALSVNLERLADLREDRGHRMRALDLYRESYDIAGRLAAADPARFGRTWPRRGRD